MSHRPAAVSEENTDDKERFIFASTKAPREM
jgi:hypothetical protein